jgi:cytochrome c oxidase accessory protein FixG
MDASTGKREWIYPAWVKGVFQSRRRWTFAVLHAILFVTPWIHARGDQLIRVDLGGRQMIVAGSIFTPSDTIFLVFALLFSAFLLFFVTALWGRIWCGYACPQTVFLETFVHAVERRLEGDRGKRMALDRGPWTADKLARKLAKHAIFVAAALLVAGSFVGWFAGTRQLLSGSASHAAYGMVAFFSAVMYLDFAWFREQFCNFLCPYARFQGVLADDSSLIVTYDAPRGEPRRARDVDRSAQGDCIDCKKCVTVCPVGIDIRNGYQLECIGCAKCVDACAPIMAKLGRDNLVRYSTIIEDAGGKTTKLRPRPMIYAGLMAASAAAALGLLVTRHPLDVTVNRAPGTLFTVDDDGTTRNTFLLQITNRKYVTEAAEVTVSVEGLPEATVVIPPVSLATGEETKIPLVILAPPDLPQQRTWPVDIHVMTDFDEVVIPTTFKTAASL